MEHTEKNIDDLFRDELGDYAETPPPAAWGALEKKLKAVPPGASGFSGKRIGYIAMLCILVMFMVPLAKKIPGLQGSTSSTGTQDNTAADNSTRAIATNNGQSGPGHWSANSAIDNNRSEDAQPDTIAKPTTNTA